MRRRLSWRSCRINWRRSRLTGLAQPGSEEVPAQGESLRAAFPATAAAPDRGEQLRAAFAREPTRETGQEAEARRQALRQPDPPAVERGQDRDRGPER